MVAKSYQKYALDGEPFEADNGRMYVKLSTGKIVRWYSAIEYKWLYPDDPDPVEEVAKPVSHKEIFGFQKGFITIFKGNTYDELPWFRNTSCRYARHFGWYLVSTDEMPEGMPEDIQPVRLPWEAVCANATELMSEDRVREVVETYLNDPTPSEFQGEVGERLERTLTVMKVMRLESYNFGSSWLHVFMDDQENEYVWTTASKVLKVGETYKVRGTVKAHSVFKNSKQTILLRCKLEEV